MSIGASRPLREGVGRQPSTIAHKLNVLRRVYAAAVAAGLRCSLVNEEVGGRRPAQLETCRRHGAWMPTSKGDDPIFVKCCDNAIVSAMLRQGLTVKEASDRLHVSPQRIRALVSRRQLAAERSADILLIDPAAVERRAQLHHVAHRSLESANAWALLALASREPSLAPSLAAVRPSVRSRLRARLRRASMRELVPLLRKRADVHWLRAADDDLKSILAEPGVVATGVSVAAHYGLDITAPGVAELYAGPELATAIQRKYRLEPSTRANVVLHVINSRWPFAEGLERAPALVAALDLADAPDRRSARAGRAYLAERID